MVKQAILKQVFQEWDGMKQVFSRMNRGSYTSSTPLSIFREWGRGALSLNGGAPILWRLRSPIFLLQRWRMAVENVLRANFSQEPTTSHLRSLFSLFSQKWGATLSSWRRAPTGSAFLSFFREFPFSKDVWLPLMSTMNLQCFNVGYVHNIIRCIIRYKSQNTHPGLTARCSYGVSYGSLYGPASGLEGSMFCRICKPLPGL